MKLQQFYLIFVGYLNRRVHPEPEVDSLTNANAEEVELGELPQNSPVSSPDTIERFAEFAKFNPVL